MSSSAGLVLESAGLVLESAGLDLENAGLVLEVQGCVQCRDVQVQGCPCSAGMSSAGMSKCRDVPVQMLCYVCGCIGFRVGGGREREMSSIQMYYLEVSCEYVGKA